MSNTGEADKQPDQPHKPFCPKCGSTDIRESQSHRMMDFLLKSFSLYPHRCRSCRKRFYLRKRGEPDDDVHDDADDERAAHNGVADAANAPDPKTTPGGETRL
jgi:hypothetical protein